MRDSTTIDNRGTIEVAETLYGVSMREDGVSTVLSMRMAGELAR
jgi:chromosome segregation protein